MVAPKRPLSGYFRFAATVRPKLEREHGVSGIKTAPFISKAWNSLDESKKSKFQNAAQKDMAVWKRKMEAYKKTAAYADEMAAKKAKKFAKRPKDKNAPKRAATAYMLYGSDVRPKLMKQHNEVTVVMKKIGEMWGTLSTADKAKYEKKAAAAKVKYEKALAAYQKSAKYAAFQQELAAWQQKKKAFQNEGKPKKAVKK